METGRPRALLVGILTSGGSAAEVADHLDELAQLVDTMGFDVAHTETVRITRPQPVYLVGSGKAEELSAVAEGLGVECIIFDDELSPSQQRNWERLTSVAVIDRQEVILDIFAERARSKPAVTQVALARLEYSLPRLKRAWTHLSRQKGGAKGTRGEGETQLEVDRRIALRRIARLKTELVKLERRRATMRKRRDSGPTPVGAIVGYTNAGKSSLLNALAGSEVFVEDRLFATLDPTSRAVQLSGDETVILTDTVGFVRKLPHSLVESFRTTLDESLYADFLIHVLDSSRVNLADQYATTVAVLEELRAADKPTIVVFNKMDLFDSDARDARHFFAPTGAVTAVVEVSARTGAGLDALRTAMSELIHAQSRVVRFRFPASRSDLAALLHRSGQVLREEYDDEGILMEAKVSDETGRRLAAFTTA